MDEPGVVTGYDNLAWLYDRHWGREYPDAAMAFLEKALFPAIAPGARILDLCCGTGHLAGRIKERGFAVFGADISLPMLGYAAKRCGPGRVFAADARRLASTGPFDAVVSTFESMNHMSSLEWLKDAFSGVHGALRPGGLFVFDLLMEEAYVKCWGKSMSIVEDDLVCVIRGGYDRPSQEAHISVTLLRLNGGWARSDISISERYYPAEVVTGALLECGFAGPRVYASRKDFEMNGDIGIGRVFMTARSVGG